MLNHSQTESSALSAVICSQGLIQGVNVKRDSQSYDREIARLGELRCKSLESRQDLGGGKGVNRRIARPKAAIETDRKNPLVDSIKKHRLSHEKLNRFTNFVHVGKRARNSPRIQSASCEVSQGWSLFWFGTWWFRPRRATQEYSTYAPDTS